MLKKYFKSLWVYNKKLRQEYIIDMASRIEKPVMKYLDLGCDNGSFTQKVRKACRAKAVYGIEINSKRAKEAEKKDILVKESDLNIKFPYKSNTFDLVTADQVIEHLVDVDNFVSEIHRVLKPDGYAIVCTENLASFHNILALIFGSQPFTGPNISSKFRIGYHPIGPKTAKESIYNTAPNELEDHKRVMTYKALISLFRFYEFEIVTGKGFGYLPLPPLMGNILAAVDKNHSQFILVVVRKKN